MTEYYEYTCMCPTLSRKTNNRPMITRQGSAQNYEYCGHVESTYYKNKVKLIATSDEEAQRIFTKWYYNALEDLINVTNVQLDIAKTMKCQVRSNYSLKVKSCL